MKLSGPGFCIPLILLLAGGLLADTYNPKIELGPFAGKVTVGPGMQATGHRLWGSEIVGQDLRGACFDDCDLCGVIFRQCEFQGATFRRAVLTGVTIDDCEWGNNNFEDAVINGIKYIYSDQFAVTTDNLVTTWSYKHKDLSECTINSNAGKALDFSGFNLTSASLQRVSNCRFVGAKLVRTVFEQCDLRECAFGDAKLDSCWFRFCKLDFARLQRTAAYITASNLEYVELSSDADFSNRALCEPQLTRTGVGKLLLTNTGINGVTLNEISSQQLMDTLSYKMRNLSRCCFRKCDFSNCDFSRHLLVRTQFEECNLTNCNFTDAVITDAVFDGCTGLTPEQMRTTWDHKSQR